MGKDELGDKISLLILIQIFFEKTINWSTFDFGYDT